MEPSSLDVVTMSFAMEKSCISRFLSRPQNTFHMNGHQTFVNGIVAVRLFKIKFQIQIKFNAYIWFFTSFSLLCCAFIREWTGFRAVCRFQVRMIARMIAINQRIYIHLSHCVCVALTVLNTVTLLCNKIDKMANSKFSAETLIPICESQRFCRLYSTEKKNKWNVVCTFGIALLKFITIHTIRNA